MECEYMTAKDVSKLLNISEKTIYNWASRKRFPKPIKFGRAVRWKRTDVLSALEKRTIGVYQK